MADSREGEEESFFSVDACYCCQCNHAVYAVLKLNGCSSLGDRELGGDDVGEGQEPLGKSDNFPAAPELMVHDAGVTPTMSPNPACKRKERQRGTVEPQQPVPGEPQPQGDEEVFDEATFTSSLDLTPSVQSVGGN